jgi:hypothetical protein
VYQIFFREYVASQRAADQRRDKGEDDTGLRNLFQHTLGLNAFEQQALNSAAQTCVETQDANVRTARQLAQQLKLNPNNPSLKAQIGQLRKASQSAVAEGVQQLRASLTPPGFERLDLKIRIHVVPNLRSSAPPAGGQQSPGGN